MKIRKMNKIHWQEWKPEFDENKKLGTVLSEMPRDPPNKIPWQVWLLENPESPISFPGSISLYRHDCIHALLCTSFYGEDEAFTVGFTMGTAEWKFGWLIKLFAWLTTWFYPGEYKWNKNQLEHFWDGFKRGQKSGMFNLNNFQFEDYENLTLKNLRKMIGIEWMDTSLSYKEWSQRWSDHKFVKKDQNAS